jgi:hypothetical protein
MNVFELWEALRRAGVAVRIAGDRVMVLSPNGAEVVYFEIDHNGVAQLYVESNDD